MLSRDERIRLRDEASKLNVYDLGWRRNLKSIFCPDQPMSVKAMLACFWPPHRPENRYVTLGRCEKFETDQIGMRRLGDIPSNMIRERFSD